MGMVIEEWEAEEGDVQVPSSLSQAELENISHS